MHTCSEELWLAEMPLAGVVPYISNCASQPADECGSSEEWATETPSNLQVRS